MDLSQDRVKWWVFILAVPKLQFSLSESYVISWLVCQFLCIMSRETEHVIHL